MSRPGPSMAPPRSASPAQRGPLIAVCQAPPELAAGTVEWSTLCERVRSARPDLLLLNELPFGRWIAAGERFDAAAWRASCVRHAAGLGRLAELGAPNVAATRPRELDGRRVNEAFVWSPAAGASAVGHTKQSFPNEPGYFEARWFEAGAMRDGLALCGGMTIGFQICTELMFNENARRLGRAGAELLLVPRAVGGGSLERWRTASRMAAIVSGCYVASSNRGGVDGAGQEFGGAGWIVDPAGEIVAETSAASPVVSHRIDLDRVASAQREYPCYVPERAAR